MYQSHFGLREEPFGVTPDRRFFYQTAQHREALADCGSLTKTLAQQDWQRFSAMVRLEPVAKQDVQDCMRGSEHP